VFPSQIEEALLAVKNVATLPDHFNAREGLDRLEIQIEVTAEVFSDKVGNLEELQRKLIRAIEDIIGIRATVLLVEPHTIMRSEGKAKRVIDNRNLDNKQMKGALL